MENKELKERCIDEETGRENIDLKKFKEITNFEKTKETLENIKLEIPNLPEINNISKFSLKIDERIMEEIIKPKYEFINQLYNDNRLLHRELTRQAKIVEKAEKYEKERSSIISNNALLHNQVDIMKKEYKEKEFDLEWKYKNKIKSLE